MSCNNPCYAYPGADAEHRPVVFEHLSALLSTPTQYSILLIERAVVGLLRVCRILAKKVSSISCRSLINLNLICIQPSLRDQVFVSFDLLAGLPPIVASAVAEQVMAGLILIVQEHQGIMNSQTEWNVVFALIRSTISHPEASRQSFEMLSQLVSGDQHITLDNYPGLIALLDDFAAVASVTVNAQQQGRRNQALNSTK